MAEDMGGDSYALPGYFGDKRWDYYRLNSHGHNLLLFNNQSQAEKTEAKIVAFNATSTPVGTVTVDGWAVVNLTDAYAGAAGVASVLRGFVSISDTNGVLVVDEILYHGTGTPVNVTWQIHTQAQITLSNETVGASLTRDNVTASLALLGQPTSCPGLTTLTAHSLVDVLPDPPFDSAKGYKRLDGLVHDPSKGGCTKMAWALGTPEVVEVFTSGKLTVRPIAQWATVGPVGSSGL